MTAHQHSAPRCLALLRHRALACAAAAAIVACSDSGSPADAALMGGGATASGGSTTSGVQKLPWSLARKARVTLGAQANSPDFLGRVFEAALLSDGRLVVIDVERRERAVSIFDTSGRWVRAVSRYGFGPGEFSSGPRWLSVLPGDTILYQTGRSMVAVLPDGRLVKEFMIGLVGYTAQGTRPRSACYALKFLVRDGIICARDSGPNTAARATYSLWKADSTGTPGDSLAAVWLILHHTPSPAIQGLANTYPMVAIGEVLVREDELVVVAGDKPGYTVLDSHGDTKRQVTLPGQAISRTTPDEKALRQLARDSVEAILSLAWATGARTARPSERDIGRALARIDTMHFPDSLPFWSAAVVDKAGNVWLRRYVSPHVPQSMSAWIVFDSSDNVRGEVLLPSSLEVLEIGVDYVVTRRFTPDFTPVIEVYDLLKDRWAVVTDANDVRAVAQFRINW